MLKLEIKPYQLDFTFSAGTSRGVMKDHRIWFLKVYEKKNPGVIGVGEAAPLPRLSIDDIELIEQVLAGLEESLSKVSRPVNESEALTLAKRLVPPAFPSVRFGLEIALLDLLNEGTRQIVDNQFSTGNKAIAINGLIWMGDEALMKERVDEKLEDGFDCIKMKIGAIDFQKELDLLGYLRSKSDDLIIRVDANGAFNVREALGKLKALSEFDLHSIEQPVLPNQSEAMQLLCKIGAVPVALDEELIGKPQTEQKSDLLDFLKPAFIVLKPTLLGGIDQTREWIKLAEERGIGWWITSALESNIALNAICQLTAQYDNSIQQGLGTGQLYHNNIASPLEVSEGFIRYNQALKWGDPFSK